MGGRGGCPKKSKHAVHDGIVFGATIPVALEEDYLVYLFAREFGYAPAVTRSMDLRTREHLLGMFQGERDGVEHRREWFK